MFKLGVSIDEVYRALQTLLGGYYVNQFNRFGRVWKVFVEAEPEYRTRATEVGQFYVRNSAGTMVPLSTLVNMQQSVRPRIYHALQRVPQHRDFRRSRRPATAPVTR